MTNAATFASSVLRASLNPEERPRLWKPDPRNKPQTLAYDMADKVMELGYGGQAGGGKTDLILGLAATKFNRSLILRRVSPQLEHIILRGSEIFRTRYVAGDQKRWAFGKQLVKLGSCQYEENWENYQGRPHDLLAFDEAAQFTGTMVRNIAGWTRTTIGDQNTLTLLCFNPPTSAEGEWIIDYFAPWLKQNHPNPAASGEIRWFAYILNEQGKDEQIEVGGGEIFEHNGKLVYPISRTFIKAHLDDNPYIDEEYKRRIDTTPEPLRSILKGDWTIKMEDDPSQMIPTAWVLEAMNRWKQTPKPEMLQSALGVDVAYGGDDKTVISRLYGVWFAELLAYAGYLTPDGIEAKKKILDALEGNPPIGIDIVGYGSSAYDQLKVENYTRPANQQLKLIAINGGAKADGISQNGMLQFANLRAMMYWRFREALNPENGENICLPPSHALRIELCEGRWQLASGKVQMEAKDQIKKRLKRSPDLADAVVQAWHVRHGANRSEFLFF